MQFQTQILPTDLTSPCQNTVHHTDSIIKHLNKIMQRKQQNVTITRNSYKIHMKVTNNDSIKPLTTETHLKTPPIPDDIKEHRIYIHITFTPLHSHVVYYENSYLAFLLRQWRYSNKSYTDTSSSPGHHYSQRQR
jgi:hypothetical protein